MIKRILVVDDDPQLLEELKCSLMDDYEVFTLQNSKDVLDTANRLKPDVVILDVRLPGESGLQLACKLKYFSDLNDTKIIVMSGNYKKRYEILTEICGFKGFLSKPFDYKELQSKIEE